MGQAKAGLMYTVDDSSNDVHAKAEFAYTSTGFVITLTNTEVNTLDASQAISGFSFTVNTASMGVPTAFSELKGTSTDFASHPAVAVDDTTIGDTKENWQFTANSSTGKLTTINGGQPNYLIVASGSTPNSSLTGTHLPSFTGATQFFFTDADMPLTLSTANITSFTFQFGTKPEFVEGGGGGGTSMPPDVAPEPSTLAMAASGLTALTLVFLRRLRRRSGLASS